jgi:membrane associated rhomboid family serine protease
MQIKQYNLISSIYPSLLAVILLWVIQSCGVLFHLDLSLLGIIPLDWQRAYGILTAPLVHGSYQHLFNNTLPLLVLGTVLTYGYPNSRWWVLGISWLCSGLGVWLFARNAVHLGASGVCHGLFFYLLTVAILRRDKRSVALMMIAFFMYGSMIMSIFPSDPKVSYEAHFFGAVGGVFGAFLLWRKDPKPTIKPYVWEQREHLDDEDPIIGDLWQQGDRESTDTDITPLHRQQEHPLNSPYARGQKGKHPHNATHRQGHHNRAHHKDN